MKLPRAFYDRPTLDVARDLLGKVLVHRRGRGVLTSGVIVEVEAYIGESDPACHAAPGPTRRNEPLYGPPGIAYVYLNYGIHYLVNVVTEAEGVPAAVLIRALEPLDGIDVDAAPPRRAMKGDGRSARDRATRHDLCRGPGQPDDGDGHHARGQSSAICWAIGCSSRIGGIDAGPIVWGPRIGIRVGTDRPWRVWLAGQSRSLRGHAGQRTTVTEVRPPLDDVRPVV